MASNAETDKPVADQQPGAERLETALDLKLCWCPPGKFVMGSPPHERGRFDSGNNEDQVFVTIARGFWMGKHPVTQGQWQQLSENVPSQFSGTHRPVEMVSWDDAANFCQRLTQSARERGELPAGWEYRLPTEAQWEYACRAGWSTAYCFGNDPERLGDYAWFEDNSDFETREVGKKRANAWGLCDMHGNVWEWCRDWYQRTMPGGEDPEATKATSYRVIRGGCWLVVGDICRCASRSRAAPDNCFDFLGLRVALVPVEDP